MKRSRDLISSSTSSVEETSPEHPSQRLRQPQKTFKMEGEGLDPADVGEVTLKDLFMQLNGIKRDFELSFGNVRQDIVSLRHEVQENIKLLRDEFTEFKVSFDNANVDIENNKERIAQHDKEIAEMRVSCETLKVEIKRQKEKNLRLDRYSRRENIRLLFVDEEDDENTEELFVKCLIEMKVYHPQMRFQGVHRVDRGADNHPARSRRGKQPRHIIARFVCRKDRDLVWKQKEKIKETEHFKQAFFVQDLPKEDANEEYKLRRAMKCARNVFNMEVSIRRRRLVMADSGLSYSFDELPEFLKKEAFK